MVRKLLRITYYAGMTIVLILVALAGYTQTGGFRASLKDYILSHYQTALNAHLAIGRIEGNLVTGIRLYDVSLRRADTSLFSADRIDLSHDPLVLIFKRISLGRVSIINPRFELYRSTSGVWNISDLLVSSSDTAASAWVVSVKNFELINARVTMVDSALIDERARGLRSPPPPGVVDYARVTLDSLNAEAGLRIRPSETDVQLRLLTFVLKNPRMDLKHLQGNFKLTKNGASASNMMLATDRSRVNLNASLSNVNIATLKNLAELKTKPVSLDLEVGNLDTRELKEFLYPWVDFLDEDLALEVHASGEFGRLNVRKVVVETPKSTIAIGGTITNLHKPEDLELDLLSANSVIDPDDAAAHIPGLSLPDLGALGRTRFRLTFKGAPTDFQSTLKAETQVGDVDVNTQLRISDVLQYKTSFVTNDLDLGKLFGNTDLESRLNLNGTLTGIGTDIYTTSAVARVELDSSVFWGMPLGESAFVFDLSNDVLRSHVQLHARSTTIELSSVLKFPRGDSVSYSLNGSVNALNLADIIRDDQFASDLSFAVKASGTGTSINRLRNSATLSFLRSMYDNVPFEKGEIQTSLNLSRSDRSVFTFHTEPVDMNVEGRFTLPALVENVINGETIVSEAIAHRFGALDSLRGASVSPGGSTKTSILTSKRPKYIDVAYRIQARNLYPIGVFFRKNLAGSLSLNGMLKGTVDSLDFNGVSRIQSFAYWNRTDSYRSNQGTLSLDLKNISRTGLMGILNTKLDIQSDKFSVNNLSFHNTSLALDSRSDSGSYHWSALIDSAYQVDLQGTSIFSSANVYSFELSRLQLGMDAYTLENNEPVDVKLGRDGLYVQDLTLTHEVEELGVSGYFNPSGISDLNFTVNDFLLNNLKSVLNKTNLADPVKDINGILNASLQLKGNMNDPDMTLDLTANGFRSGNVVFGQVVARSSYTDHLLSLFIELRNKPEEQESKPDLLISGTVPYEFASAETRGRRPNGEINLTMFSKGLSLSFLDPFLPAVSNLSGTLICDMKIHGTVDAPTYEGSIALQDTKFYFKPLGIYYLVQGKLIPNGNRVGLDNVVIRNIPQDRNDGRMKLSGTFSLAGLKLEDFDLRADGQLLVMKESSRIVGQKFYGDLVLGTGPDGARWEGRPSDSKVSGDVVIRNGRIIFPPEREVASVASKAVNVIFRDDTSKVSSSTEEKRQAISLTKEGSTQYASLGPVPNPERSLSDFSNPSEPTNPEAAANSFLDNIAYDLNIDVQSPTTILFIFNTQPSEELFADLEGKLAFSKNVSQTRLTGEMNLESRSYYSFFKRFEASGTIDFGGDPLNPELNVTAKYTGTHNLDATNGISADTAKTPSGQRLLSERVDVLLKITGTKNRPKTKFELDFPDRDKNSQYVSKDPDGDAMSFLVTGYLKDELDPQQRGSYLTANMLSSLTAGLITGPLTNALKKQISAIQSVDLQYYGGDWNKTDVRVTAAISSAVIRFGGRVIEGINNTNVSVEVPVGSMFGSDRWQNLLFKYERKVDAVESVDQRAQSNSLSLFYRIIF